MGDLANMLSPTKSPDEKSSINNSATQTWATSAANWTRFFSKKLSAWGVEERGIRPVAVEDRAETHLIKIFFVWLSANTNILSFASGSLGPVTFGLGLRDSCLVILFFNLICAIPPAYLTTWGPKLGSRQLCASRYTFGYYGAMIPGLLSVASGVGFAVLNNILGGQALSSIANMSWTVGIVIISVISLFVSFCGLRVLNWYQNCVWVPCLVVFVVVTGVSGKHFVNTPGPTAPATAVQICSFGATIAGNMISWGAISSDYTVYFHPRVSSWRLFVYSYLGLNISTITLQCLGAAAAISAPSVPAWNAGYTDGNVGGLLNAMLSPVGGFRKVLMALLSLSLTGCNAPIIYSMCMAFQTLIPPLAAVPRYVFSVLATAV
ncbi:permease for cytosine/purines, uracil, thiamine, allantoin-domain-containing protein [Russula ochroleuca]|uniref:Permease for cytosine/purines, uracil, thiamine, allantoin-domain-containing protein n=1 Tax=Russula ochroleuca TaxID=152965 RepID=A0A9P5MWF9_9AGAM|nr:permease for cytosine/purines, uracil, thiamine, allantoin-domain-containing protein [Russula ochroleuca]